MRTERPRRWRLIRRGGRLRRRRRRWGRRRVGSSMFRRRCCSWCSGDGLATSSESHGCLQMLVPPTASQQAKCNSYLKKPARVDVRAQNSKIKSTRRASLGVGLSRLCLAYSRWPRPTDAMPTFATREIISFAWVSYCAARVGRGYGGRAVTASEPLAASLLFCRDAAAAAFCFLTRACRLILMTQELHLGNQHRHFLRSRSLDKSMVA